MKKSSKLEKINRMIDSTNIPSNLRNLGSVFILKSSRSE